MENKNKNGIVKAQESSQDLLDKQTSICPTDELKGSKRQTKAKYEEVMELLMKIKSQVESLERQMQILKRAIK